MGETYICERVLVMVVVARVNVGCRVLTSTCSSSRPERGGGMVGERVAWWLICEMVAWVREWHICEMVAWVREGHICEMVAWVREGHGGMVGERVWGAGWAAERPCLSTQSGAGCGAART